MNELRTEFESSAEESALVCKLGSLTLLSQEEVDFLESLQRNTLQIEPDRDFISDGEDFPSTFVVQSGWAIRYIALADGRRQILSFALPGDILGLHINFRRKSNYSAAALTKCRLAAIDPLRVIEIAQKFPLLSAGLSWCTAREFAVLGDQALRLGRLTAYERLCHLSLELYYRQSALGAIQEDGWMDFPLTQAVIADTLGLSIVHVNRQLKELRNDGLVRVKRRRMQLLDIERMKNICEFRSHHFERFRG